MIKRHKVLLVSAVSGVALLVVSNGCTSQTCSYLTYAAYFAFGVCALILAYQILKLLKKLCECFADCCCDNCCQCIFGRSQYRLRESLIRDSIRLIGSVDYAQNQQIPHEPEVPIPHFYQYSEQVGQQEGGFRKTFNQEQCTICLQPFNPEDQIVRIKCGHKYHEICISDWIVKNDKCPTCRENVF